MISTLVSSVIYSLGNIFSWPYYGGIWSSNYSLDLASNCSTIIHDMSSMTTSLQKNPSTQGQDPPQWEFLKMAVTWGYFLIGCQMTMVLDILHIRALPPSEIYHQAQFFIIFWWWYLWISNNRSQSKPVPIFDNFYQIMRVRF